MKRSLLIVLLLATFGSACGESDEEQAINDVCDARADIEKQVDELSNLTLANATVDGITGNLNAIQDDLGTIANAQGDLNDERRQQVESANKEFSSQVQSIADDLGSSLSLSGAGDQLQSALNQLANSYKQTFAKVDCG
jgi:molybdopterin converting factor small subunit